jgi:transposase-like protein
MQGGVAKFNALKCHSTSRYNASVLQQELSMISFFTGNDPKFIILQCLRWCATYALSYRNIAEVMAERDFEIDHATLNRGMLHYAPLLAKKAKKL